MRRLLILVSVLSAAPPARAGAEIAVLTNGLTFKAVSHRVEDGTIFLSLKGGGEVGLPPESVRGFVPDEVVEEVAAPGGDLPALVARAAQRHGLDPDLVRAVVAVESGFRPEAVSPKGAQGLMQLMPATAAELGVRDAFDPAQNLDAGTRHLGSLLTLYGGDVARALAAYNAGAKAVDRSHGIPPFRETQEYVRRVLQRYKAAR